ncbi:hypothetical protein C0J52_17418 [Blattella germanica]|nr:hypothetical protein C0J52_17418 [Blattella germanica]
MDFPSPLIFFYFIVVAVKTKKNRLDEGNLHARRPWRAPGLTRQHEISRWELAEEHENWNLSRWNCVMFSDETRICLKLDSGQILIWRVPGNAARLRHAVLHYQQGGGCIMFWACIMHGRNTPLLPIEANMTAEFRQYTSLTIVATKIGLSRQLSCLVVVPILAARWQCRRRCLWLQVFAVDVRVISVVFSPGALVLCELVLLQESVLRCTSADERCAQDVPGPSSCAPSFSISLVGSGTTPEDK